MCTPTVTLAPFALAALGSMPNPPVITVEQRISVEWNPGHEAVLRIAVESETDLDRVQIFRPDGRSLGEFDARDRLPRGLAGLDLELREADLATLEENYREGRYALRAATPDGRIAVGCATLSFAMPPQPSVLHPQPDSIVPGGNLHVVWNPDPGAAGYELTLEQEDDDGLRVRLPPERHSFLVPDGILAPGLETSLEVAAIGANGNRTVVEVTFTIQP